MTDLSKLSDDELDAIIAGKDVTQAPPGQGASVLSERNAAVDEKQSRKPKLKAEEIEPSPWKRAAAAYFGSVQEPVLGAIEKFETTFPGATPEARKSTLEKIGASRAERRANQRDLEATTAGQFGSFVGKAAPLLLSKTPAGAAGIAGLEGFLGGGPDAPEGWWNEMASSGLSSGIDAASVYLPAKGLQIVGKGVNAARGNLTADGQKAMEVDAAARRLGLPKPTLGQLDPHAPSALRAHPELVQAQAEALEKAMAGSRSVPNPAGGVADDIVPGANLKKAAVDAINVRKAQATELYKAVDDFAQGNNLGTVPANYTVNVLSDINRKLTAAGKDPTGNNLVFNLLDRYDPDAFVWLKNSATPAAAKKAGMNMVDFHSARVAVNRSLGALDRLDPAKMTDDQIVARKLLFELKSALDNDVARWAKANSGNAEAMNLYKRANDFYATTGADVIQNPLSKKFMARGPRGFQTPEQMYNAVLNPNNSTLVDRLFPTMKQHGRDMFNVLRELPDVGATVATRAAPAAEHGGLQALAGAALHRPGLALAEYAPGLRWLSSQHPTKMMYFARNPEGAVARSSNAASALPSSALEEWGNRILGREPR